MHLLVDTLGHLLALHVTAANEEERLQVSPLCATAQAETDNSRELVYADRTTGGGGGR